MSGGALALTGLRGHARRLGATVLAIVIGVGFVAAALTGITSVERGVAQSVAAGLVDRDLVVTADREAVTGDVLAELRALQEVDVVDQAAAVHGERSTSFVLAVTMPRGPGVQVRDGALPAGAEPGVAVSTTMAEVGSLQVGDEVDFVPFDPGDRAGKAVSLPVVGVVDLGADPMLAGQEVMVATLPTLRDLDPELTYQDVLLDAAAGFSAEEATAAVTATTDGLRVRTGQDEADLRVQAMTGQTDVLGAILLGFGGVALATSAIVIANTFAIVLAQRTRELALLRCLGATRRQVRRMVLTEAAVLGAVASTAGVLAGLGVAWAAMAALGAADVGVPIAAGLSPTPTSVLLPWAVGVLVTLVAAWWPARAATRVSPLAAMQPVGSPTAGSRAGAVCILGAAALLVLGVLGLTYAALSRSVGIGVAGGVLSFAGVLLLGVLVVPWAVRTLGALTPWTGVPGRLAVDHAVSNPRRAAATSAALLVGVTLITMTSVGAASAQRTAEQEIAANNPVDVVVLSESVDAGGAGAETEQGPGLDGPSFAAGALSQGAQTRLRQLPATEVTTPLTGSVLTITDAADTWQIQDVVLGVDPATATAVLRDPQQLDVLRPGTVGASADLLEGWGIAPGERVTVTGPDGTVQAEVVPFGIGFTWVAHPDVLAAVDADAAVTGAALRLDDEAPVDEALTDVRAAVEGEPVRIDGSAPTRAVLTGLLDVLVLVTTALLGVAVLIAVVGIANTLSLSVLERGREHALLRALGLTRGQLRSTLAIEGTLLALVSALLGLGLGVGYAWFGVQSLLPDGVGATLTVPWPTVGAVLVLAVTAGLLASVLPARRAARIAPAQGLVTP